MRNAFLWALLFSVSASIAPAQSKAKQDPFGRVPQSLLPNDPELMAYLRAASEDSENGSYESAHRTLEKGLAASKNKSSKEDVAKMVSAFANAENALGRFESARSLNEEALNIANETGNLALQAELLISQASYVSTLGRKKDAEVILVEVIARARKGKELYVLAHALGELGAIRATIGDHKEARVSLEEAILIDRQNDYTFLPLHLWYDAVATANSEADLGFTKMKQAFAAAKVEENYVVIDLAVVGLAAFHVEKKELNQAIKLIETVRNGSIEGLDPDAQMKAKRVLDLPAVKGALLNISAVIFSHSGDKQLERASQLELYEFAKKRGMTAVMAESAFKLAEILRTSGDLSGASPLYSEAAQAWMTLNEPKQAQRVLIAQGDMLLMASKFEEAIKPLQQLIETSNKANDSSTLFVAWKALAQAYSVEKNAEAQFQALQQADKIYLADPLKVDVKDAMHLYGMLSINSHNRKDVFETFLNQEKVLVLAAHAGDQDGLRFTVPVVMNGVKLLNLEKSIEENIAKGEIFAAFEETLLLAAFDINAVQLKGFEGKTIDVREHYSRIFQLTTALLEKGATEKDFQGLFQALGPIQGSLQAPILTAFASYFEKRDLKFAAQKVSEAIEGPWSQYIADPRSRAWLTCHTGELFLRIGDFARSHKFIQPCMQMAVEQKDDEVIKRAHLLRAYHQDSNKQQKAESWRYLINAYPKDPDFRERLGWIDFNEKRISEAISEWEIQLRLSEGKAKAHAFMNIATGLKARNQAGDLDRAKNELLHAESIFKSLHDKVGSAKVALALAELADSRNDEGQALKQVGLAIAIARAAGDPYTLAQSLSLHGDTELKTGNRPGALNSYLESAANFEKSNNPVQQAWQLKAAARQYFELNQLQLARETIVKAVGLADKTDSLEIKYWVRRDYSQFLLSQGEYEEGIQQSEACLTLSKDIQDPRNQAWALKSLAVELPEIGDWGKAEKYGLEALHLARQLSLPEEEAEIYDALMSIYGDRRSQVKDLGKALDYYEKAKILLKSIKNPNFQISYLNLSEIYLQLKRFDEGIKIQRDLVGYCGREKDHQCEAHAWISMAEMFRGNGDFNGARNALQEAAPHVEKSQDFYTSGRLLFTLAGQSLAEGKCAESADLYQQVIAYIEKVRIGSGGREKKSVSETYSLVYDELQVAMYCLAEQQPLRKQETAWSALKYAESNKASSFSREWGQTFLRELRKSVPSQILEMDEQVALRTSRLEEELIAVKTGVRGGRPLDAVIKDLQLSRKEFDSHIADLRAKHPKYAAIKYPLPVDPEKLSLIDGELVIDLKMTDQATFVWMLMKKNQQTVLLHYYKIKQSREWLEAKIGNIRDVFNAGTPDNLKPQDLEELFNEIFPVGVQKDVLAARRIVVIPDGAFYLLPFEILTSKPISYPFAATAITYQPSLAALSYSRAGKGKPQWSHAYFGLGDPITDIQNAKPNPSSPAPEKIDLRSIAELKARGFDFERLPDTSTEVKRIAELFEQKNLTVEVRLGDLATKNGLFMTDLTKFQYLHFATHGVAPQGGIQEPALVFSYRGDDVQKMLLPISEIVGLRLDAEMVTLSACNTGTGKISRAEGVMNLGRAFLMAGTRNVTVSLWSVADQSTSLLMQEYYREINKGTAKPEALAAARTKLRKDPKYSNPFYWGPFVLIGD